MIPSLQTLLLLLNYQYGAACRSRNYDGLNYRGTLHFPCGKNLGSKVISGTLANHIYHVQA